jgi:hypothetical protein
MSETPMDENRLREMYVEHGMTGDAIARELGCKAGVVYRRLAKIGIERRPIGPVKGHRFSAILPAEPVVGPAEEFLFPAETEEQAAMWAGAWFGPNQNRQAA